MTFQYKKHLKDQTFQKVKAGTQRSDQKDRSQRIKKERRPAALTSLLLIVSMGISGVPAYASAAFPLI